MHAIVATVRVGDVEAARKSLASLRLELVPRAPGFVSAYWLEAGQQHWRMSVIVFETKEHAREGGRGLPAPSAARRHAADPRDPRGLRQRLTSSGNIHRFEQSELGPPPIATGDWR